MDDLELTRRCAEAMGYTKITCHWGSLPLMTQETALYNPLHDDAQLAALIKKFRGDPSVMRAIDLWQNFYGEPDLNRAICLAVAMRGKDG